MPFFKRHGTNQFIDVESARLNERFGNWLHASNVAGVLSHWRYEVGLTLEDTLRGADFVVHGLSPEGLQATGIGLRGRPCSLQPAGEGARQSCRLPKGSS